MPGEPTGVVLMLQVQLLDVASLESVRSFAKSWQQQNRPLHMLINNAGIFSMGGALEPRALVTETNWVNFVNQ